MSEDLVESQAFTCPRCGGHTFGSYDPSAGAPGSAVDPATGAAPVPFPVLLVRNTAGPSSLRRMCHDGYGVGCRFEWDDCDDARYFRGTGNFRPRTLIGQTIRQTAGDPETWK